MNDEAAKMTITFPPDYPWRHLVIEGEEENFVSKAAKAAASAAKAVAPQANQDNQGGPLAPTT
jgi:protein-disulfide isomerase